MLAASFVNGVLLVTDAEDAFRAERQLIDDLIEAVAAMGEFARQVLAEHSVQQKSAAHDGQGQAEDAPRRFEGQDHRNDQPAPVFME